MVDLPEHWRMCDLGAICTKPQYGWTTKAARVGKVKYLRTTDISNGQINWSEVPYCDEAPDDVGKYRVTKNDILVSRAGSVGVSCRIDEVPFDAVFASYLIRFKALDEVLPEYLSYYFRSEEYWQFISDSSAGIALPNVNASKLSRLPVPIPPLNEQRRIVAKLKGLLEKVEACQKRLAKIPAILKRFRQSVLTAACSGELTGNWRERNAPRVSVEETTVGNIVEYLGGYAYRSTSFIDSGSNQVIRIGNVRPFRLDLSISPVFIPDEIANATSRFKIFAQDILVSMTGTKYKRDYGSAAMVEEAETDLFLNQRVARLRCGNKVSPRFLLYWLQTELFRDFFFASETGNVNQGNVGADGIRKARIDLPSRPEQLEIVSRAQILLNYADQVESLYHKGNARVEELSRSILTKAFRGELVPTEDELARSTIDRGVSTLSK